MMFTIPFLIPNDFTIHIMNIRNWQEESFLRPGKLTVARLAALRLDK